MIDEVVAADALAARANEIATRLSAIAPAAFQLTKRQLREPSLLAAARVATRSADEIDAIWAAPATHDRIRAYLEEISNLAVALK